ncbi:MAG: peptidoglycan-binding protein [Verrucomicrobiota bacterium]|nr:peptidoglycan-binding protein [Verrucomicrobiota bacterium]
MKKTIAILGLIALAWTQSIQAQQPQNKKRSRPARHASAAQSHAAVHTMARNNAAHGVQRQRRNAGTQSTQHYYAIAQHQAARNAARNSRQRNITLRNNSAATQHQRAHAAQAVNRSNFARGNNAAALQNRRLRSRQDVNRSNVARQSQHSFHRHDYSGRYRNYATARRDWHRDRHDRSWWRSHYNRIVIYGGGYYYWNAGWWYPAYGYNPGYSNYVFDGPIYGYNNLAPGDVVSETQRSLAAQGYYNGAIDGDFGPRTRAAIRNYQADHGLVVSAAIDAETLDSLGLS